MAKYDRCDICDYCEVHGKRKVQHRYSGTLEKTYRGLLCTACNFAITQSKLDWEEENEDGNDTSTLSLRREFGRFR